eukprot:5700376-Pyramimonas_sp.AAC.1
MIGNWTRHCFVRLPHSRAMELPKVGRSMIPALAVKCSAVSESFTPKSFPLDAPQTARNKRVQGGHH